MALEEVLNRDTPTCGMAAALPDFDEDPQTVALKYKTQLDQLNARITLLEDEHSVIEKVIHVKKEKNQKSNQYQSISRVLEESMNEIRTIAEQIEKLQSRLHHLNSICSKNEPLIGQLESDLGNLTSKSDVIEETLSTLKSRRDKVALIWKGINSTLRSNN